MRAVTEAETESLRYLVPFVKAGHEDVPGVSGQTQEGP